MMTRVAEMMMKALDLNNGLVFFNAGMRIFLSLMILSSGWAMPG